MIYTNYHREMYGFTADNLICEANEQAFQRFCDEFGPSFKIETAVKTVAVKKNNKLIELCKKLGLEIKKGGKAHDPADWRNTLEEFLTRKYTEYWYAALDEAYDQREPSCYEKAVELLTGFGFKRDEVVSWSKDMLFSILTSSELSNLIKNRFILAGPVRSGWLAARTQKWSWMG